MLSTVLLSTLVTVCAATDAVPAAGFPSHNVLAFGAVANGTHDDTAAIQAAIDAAAQKGGLVYLPPGTYRVNGSLSLKPGVGLRGSAQAPQGIGGPHGTVIHAFGGRDNPSGDPLFHLSSSTSVNGLTVYYPEQDPNDIRSYPWTFQLEGNDTTVENITLINAWQGIRTGPANNTRHRIRSVYGCVLRYGVYVDFCTDIGRVENCQFHCHWWSSADTGGAWEPVMAYMTEHLEAYVFGRTDWEYITNNFVFPAKIGYRFIYTEQGAANGHLTGCGADACQTSLQVDAIQPMGLLVTGGQFVAFAGDDPTQLRVKPTCHGNLRLVNCSFWGPSAQNAVLQGKGNVSFNNCYLANWSKDRDDTPLIRNTSGHLQINNCTIGSPHPAAYLGPETAHAIITGNNGRGFHVIDESNGKAIIRDNEPAAFPEE